MPILTNDPIANLQALEKEQDRRDREALRCYRPAKQMAFHMSQAPERLISGGKRSGKTTGAAAEFASCVTGIPIMGAHGKPIPRKWPLSSRSDPLLYWVIGWDIDHIGQTIYHKLFSPGLFRVIKDKATGRWRTYNPASPDDAARYEESLPSEPLIPERLIAPNSWAWENKAANNFSSVKLKNGATICAYPSSAKHPKQGDSVSGIWIDEDIQFAQHLQEWQDRLTDKNGWFIWSVWPHSRNHALVELIDRADECAGEDDPPIEHFQLVMSENPFIPDDNKRLALGRMGSEEEIARRDRGELLRDAYNMYDFYPGFHLVTPASREELSVAPQTPKDKLRQVLSRQAKLPREWTRYLAIDPSHTRTAVMFGVVPPHEFEEFTLGDILLIERELVVKKFSAIRLAKAIADITGGLRYEAFIMDQQIGRQTRVGNDKTVFQTYVEAFEKACLRSRATGSGFIPGCNRPTTRYDAVRRLLDANESGSSTLMFVDQLTSETQREFKSYRKMRVVIKGTETIQDVPENPRKHDCMAALEYLSSYVLPLFRQGSAYVEPSAYGGTGSAAYQRARRILAKQNTTQPDYVHLGPGRRA